MTRALRVPNPVPFSMRGYFNVQSNETSGCSLFSPIINRIQRSGYLVCHERNIGSDFGADKLEKGVKKKKPLELRLY